MKISHLGSLVALLVFGALGTAHAADLPTTKGPPVYSPPPPVPYSWTGIYIGANGGGGWGDIKSTENSVGTSFTTTTTTATGSHSLGGALAGGQIGFNYEFSNNIVAGLEADGDWAHILGSSLGCDVFTSGVGVPIGGVAGCGTAHDVLNDFGTVRGRIGYALNDILLYGTGGWAWGTFSGNNAVTCVSGAPPATCPGASLAFTGGTGTYSTSLRSGWAAGAGAEWAFMPDWSVRVEYLHLQYDNVGWNFTTSITSLGTAGTTTTNVSSNIGVNIIRAGLNYRFDFGGPTPVAAKF